MTDEPPRNPVCPDEGRIKAIVDSADPNDNATWDWFESHLDACASCSELVENISQITARERYIVSQAMKKPGCPTSQVLATPGIDAAVVEHLVHCLTCSAERADYRLPDLLRRLNWPVVQRQAALKEWYKSLGFWLNVPLPPVSKRELAQRATICEALFYRPPESEINFFELASAVHVFSPDNPLLFIYQKSGLWQRADIGYWFWAEVPTDCPRLGMSWNELSRAGRLLSQEEYVIVRCAALALDDIQLDSRGTRSWLRARIDGEIVSVGAVESEYGWLAPFSSREPDQGCDNVGGRLSELTIHEFV